MPNYDSRPVSNHFHEAVPVHECDPQTCEVKQGFMMTILDEEESITVNSTAHNMHPASIVQAFVQTIDDSFIRNRPEGMPITVAVAQAREFIRQGTEQIETPGDFSRELTDFMSALENMMGAKESDDE